MNLRNKMYILKIKLAIRYKIKYRKKDFKIDKR